MLSMPTHLQQPWGLKLPAVQGPGGLCPRLRDEAAALLCVGSASSEAERE